MAFKISRTFSSWFILFHSRHSLGCWHNPSFKARLSKAALLPSALIQALALQNMSLWKKIVIGLVSVFLLLVATAIGGLYLLGQSSSDMCGVNLLRETPSPNGKLKAVLFQIDCGATTGFNSHVAIMPNNISLSSNTESFFAADRNGGKAPDGEGGGPEVQVDWVSDVQLDIQYHELARIFHNEKTSEGVNIVYHTFH